MKAIPASMAMAPGRPKRCLLVLGMHNSGTSLLSNLMHGTGVPLGPHLLLRDRMPEKRRPRYDYYEDADIVRLQDETLLDLQRHWSSYRAAWPLPPAYHPSRDRFRQKLQDLIPERLEGNNLWLVKDPRSAVLLEDWLLVLRQLQVEPRLLLVHRDPRSNIDSFSRKGRVPLLWAEALWQRTYQQALLASRNLPEESWAITRFEDLLLQPQAAVMELCDWLGHPVNAQQREQLAARVDQALPAFPPATGSQQDDDEGLMHPATKLLSKQLNEHSCKPLPKGLLADELQQAIDDTAAPLELNQIRPDGQTLEPKATVTIVSYPGKGEGAAEERGINLNAKALGSVLATAGHRVTMLLIGDPTPRESPEQPGLKLRYLPSSHCSQEGLEHRVASWLQDHPCDVVHLQDWPELVSSLREVLRPNPPQLIVTLSHAHEERAHGLDGLQQADWLIAATQDMASWTEQHLREGNQLVQLVVNQSCRTTAHHEQAKNWPIELSWQGFYERLPRRVAERAEAAKATTEPKNSATSAWRRLMKRILRT